MNDVRSKTIKLANAYFTIHQHSAGTAILNVTTHKGTDQHVAVWVNEDEMWKLMGMLRDWIAESEERQ